MRIGLDTTPLARPYPTGVRRACEGLLGALREFTDLEVVPLAPQAGENERLWRHRRLPYLLEELDLFGLHSMVSAFPCQGPGRRVCTVHELPWRNGTRENAGPGHRFWAQFAVGRADAVLCPTEFVRGQLVQECGAGAEHIFACPWGVEERPLMTVIEQDALLKDLGLEGASFALALGATRPKKNLAGLIRAIADRADAGPHLHLVVTGERTEQLSQDLRLARDLGLGELVHATGHLEDAALDVLNARARFACVLSHSEGFGFPTLEALLRGTPVIVTEDSAQAEVAGSLGILTQLDRTESIVLAIHQALATAPGQSEHLRQHARAFTWARCARRVEEIWGRWS